MSASVVGGRPTKIPFDASVEAQIRRLWTTARTWDDLCVPLEADRRTIKRWAERLGLPDREFEARIPPVRTNHVGRIGPLNTHKIERHCIDCKKLFMSWDRVKNQRCGCHNGEGVDTYAVVGVRLSAR